MAPCVFLFEFKSSILQADSVFGQYELVALGEKVKVKVKDLDMDEPKIMFQRALDLAQKRDLAGAEEVLIKVLSVDTKEPNALRMLGSIKLAEKQFGLAVDYLEKALEAAPGFANAVIELSAAHHLMGNSSVAVSCFRAFLESNPNNGLVWQALANLLFEMGDLGEGQIAAQQSVQFDPFYKETRSAIEALNDGKPRDAEDLFRKILQQDSNHVHALVGLASLAMDREVLIDAERLLNRANLVALNFSHVQRAWSRLYMKQSQFDPAEKSALAAVRVSPDSAECWTSLGTVSAWGLKNAEAANAFKKSLVLNPEQPRVQLSLGHVLKAAGDFDGAIAAYRNGLKLDALLGEAWWSLADLKTFKFDEKDRLQMLAQLKEKQIKLRDRDEASLSFALGKAHEDVKDYAASFEFYARGNELRAGQETFNVDRLRHQISASKEVFAKRFSVSTTDSEFVGQPIPIFVVGLPRSGSTLVDQILSSHSMVQGTMELPHILGYARELGNASAEESDRGNNPSLYPRCLEEMSMSEKLALGRRYLDETQNYHRNTPYFVDKMPNNFLHLGLISQILPKAIFVDTRRHPIGCCFSIFKQNFARGQSFSYDLDVLSQYYRCYLDLMDHWNEVLPGKIHRVIYEEMVEDTENQIGQLLGHCGLEFEDSCLSFHENERVVRTASAQQVRQPIYHSSKEAWRGFETELEPLIKSLNPVLDTWKN